MALFAIVALSVGIRFLFVDELLDRDEGSYGFVAKEILRGGIPYRDAIEMKPPGVFYLYALAIKLFGATVSGVRIFTLLYVQLTLICVFATARLLYGARAGLMAAFFFALFGSVPVMEANGSNTEVFLCLPLAAALLCMVTADQSGRREFIWLSASCAALAALIKSVAAPYILVLAIFSLFAAPDSGSRSVSIRNLAGFVLAFWLVIGGVLVYFSLNGALHDFLLWNVIIPFKYTRNLTVSGPPLRTVIPHLAPEVLTLVIASLPALYYGLVKRRSFAFLLVIAMVPAFIAGICMPMKFFHHYFVQMLPFICVLAGVGTMLILQMPGCWKAVWLTAVSVSFCWFVYRDYSYYFTDPPEMVSMRKYGTATFVNAVKVAEYVRMRTSPGDYILQWGFEPEIYFLADRRAAVPYPNSTALKVLDDVEAGVRNFVSRVLTTRPVYIIVNEEWANYPGYTELQGIMRVMYHPERVIGWGPSSFNLYRLNGV